MSTAVMSSSPRIAPSSPVAAFTFVVHASHMVERKPNIDTQSGQPIMPHATVINQRHGLGPARSQLVWCAYRLRSRAIRPPYNVTRSLSSLDAPRTVASRGPPQIPIIHSLGPTRHWSVSSFWSISSNFREDTSLPAKGPQTSVTAAYTLLCPPVGISCRALAPPIVPPAPLEL